MPSFRSSLTLPVALAMILCPTVRASIIGEALLSFPVQTEYVEDDDLATLRSLPYYDSLRKQFSGKELGEAQIVLEQLGIPATQVEEIVIGSEGHATFGLAAGTFNKESAVLKPVLKRYQARLLGTDMYCVGRATCLLFLENSTAAFGTPTFLKRMLLTRQGIVTRLGTNSDAVRLLDTGNRAAPVRGILFGRQLQSALADTLQQWFGKPMQSVKLPAPVAAVGYSMTFGQTVRLQATLQCSSTASASLLAYAMNTLSFLRPIASASGMGGDGFSFKRVTASAVDSRVQFDAYGQGYASNSK